MSTRKKDVPLLLSAVGFIGDLISKIVARLKETQTLEVLHRLVSDERLAKEFIVRFCDLAVEMAAKVKFAFPIWRAIVVGGLSSAEAWIKVLFDAGFLVGDWAEDTLNKIKEFQGQSQVSFGKATGHEFGFIGRFTTTELIARVKEFGHEPCEPDDAPALRLSYKDQPKGEAVWLVMESVRGSDGHFRIFELSCDSSGPWLFSRRANPNDAWHPDSSFVYRLSK